MRFHVTQPDVVERQQADIDKLLAERQGWLDEIERLRADIAELCDIVTQLYARAARAALKDTTP